MPELQLANIGFIVHMLPAWGGTQGRADEATTAYLRTHAQVPAARFRQYHALQPTVTATCRGRQREMAGLMGVVMFTITQDGQPRLRLPALQPATRNMQFTTAASFLISRVPDVTGTWKLEAEYTFVRRQDLTGNNNNFAYLRRLSYDPLGEYTRSVTISATEALTASGQRRAGTTQPQVSIPIDVDDI
jgi:hypothetical protein